MSEKPSRLIITASEGTCEALANKLKGKPGMLHTFQNSGFWYSNGETGPEWFTITIEAYYSDKVAIEFLVDNALSELGKSAVNWYWG